MPKKIIYILGLLLALSACASLQSPSTLPEAEQSLPSPQIATQTPQGLDTLEDIKEPEASAALASIPDPSGYAWVQIAEGFSQPLFVANAGDGSNRLFIVGQQGVIWIISEGQVLEQAFLDIRNRVGSQSNEQGLLGLAFHPNYSQNGFFYVNYTDTAGDTVISRFTVSDDPNQADSATENIILQIDQPFVNHNGGPVAFGPDGRLYIGLGDGGSGGDPQGNGQSTDTLLGKILRIDVDSADPYGIPTENPFANDGGLPEIWAYGLRNPWRFSFDSLTGDLYIADVGQQNIEEVNVLPASSASGANFGWNYFEGTNLYEGSPPDDSSFFSPVAEYNHDNGRCSITGGQVYRGQALPAWKGVYFYGDYCSGEVFALLQDANGDWQNELVYSLGELITSFGADESGELYLLGRAGGLFALRALP